MNNAGEACEAFLSGLYEGEAKTVPDTEYK
jgi:hypothetical protein